MGANFRVLFITLSTIKARSLRKKFWGLAGLSQKPLPLLTSNEIKGKKKDQNQKHPDRPEKTPPHGVSHLLGIIKNPEGHEEMNQRDEISHNNLRPLRISVISRQLSDKRTQGFQNARKGKGNLVDFSPARADGWQSFLSGLAVPAYLENTRWPG